MRRRSKPLARSRTVPRERAASTDDARRKLDARLDEALKQTFPASDPVAITGLPGGPGELSGR